MADKTDKPGLPKVTAEQRRNIAGQYERAQQVLASGNFDYGIDLLRKCCLLDPAGIVYRQMLRKAQKDKYKDNQRGQTMAFWRGLPAKLRLQAAVGTKNYVKALEYGEEILTRNPWDVSVLIAMAEAFEGLELLDQALWSLDQARRIKPDNVRVTRKLAEVLERIGNFTRAIKMWEIVRLADPQDMEAKHKVKDLAASETIARGKYDDVVSGDARGPAAVAQEESSREDKDEETDATPRKRRTNEPAEERGAKDIASLESKIQANPKLASNYLQLAGIYRRNDQFDKARSVLERGLAPTGNQFEIAIELVDVGIEPFRRNLEVTETKLQQQPDDADLRKIRARLLKEINSRELDYFRQKADRFPTEKGHHFEMGVRLLALDQVDEAIKELQIARNDPRQRTKALYYLGYCFKQRNNWRLAQRNFEEALQNIGSGDADMHKEILYQLAIGLSESGDLSRAFELGCELADIDYSYKNIGTLIEQWQQREARGDG